MPNNVYTFRGGGTENIPELPVEQVPVDVGGGDDAVLAQLALIEKERQQKALEHSIQQVKEFERLMAEAKEAQETAKQKAQAEQYDEFDRELERRIDFARKRKEQQDAERRAQIQKAMEEIANYQPVAPIQQQMTQPAGQRQVTAPNGERLIGPMIVDLSDAQFEPRGIGGSTSMHADRKPDGTMDVISKHDYTDGRALYQVYINGRWECYHPRLLSVYEGPRRIILPEKCQGKLASPMPYYGPRYQAFLGMGSQTLYLIKNPSAEHCARMVEWDGDSEDGNFVEARYVKLTEEERELRRRGL